MSAHDDTARERLSALIVEDSKADAELEVLALEQAGFAVQWHRVQDVETLAAALQDAHWDVVLCDHGMPQIDSFTVLRVLHEQGSDAPVLVVSGTVSDEVAVLAIRQGAVDFVGKADLTRLAAAVRLQLKEVQNRRARAAAEAALAESEEHYRRVIARLAEGLIVQASDGRIITCNPAAETMLGPGVAQLAGHTPPDPAWTLIGVDQAPLPAESLPASVTLRTGESMRGVVVGVRHPDGETTWLSLNSDVLPAPDDTALTEVMLSFTDITELTRRQSQLEESERFLTALAHGMAEGMFAEDANGRIIYMNPAAEQLLGWSFQELRGRLMHEVTHARHEDGATYPVEDCPIHAVRVHGHEVRVEEDFFIRKDGTPLPVAYSAAPTRSDPAFGTVVVFHDIVARLAAARRQSEEFEALSWVGRVKDALDDDRFILYAQPIVDVRTGTTLTHELLVRIIDPSGGAIEPQMFLPAAERFGLMLEIDRWVMHEAAKLAGRGFPVHFNLSGSSLGHGELIPEFARALEEHRVDPRVLMCEITETAVSEDPAAAELFVHDLVRLGCRVALDDFGMGYGTLDHLRRLPLAELKIDLSFIRNLLESPDSQNVVGAIVALAKGFGYVTVAEGVEDMRVLGLLAEYGIDCAQGFALGRPRSVADVFPESGSPLAGAQAE
jgi:PAS domain S-box-containing protein